ncbi:MAG: hypothetical protein J3K34DRAFT_400812 [Monoraphidium minutum]|nr:MAG: hypothetical protein J3K34DRAFT_400812 [Monoraphidium minutum]
MACANGTFANTTGAAACSACPLGWTSNAGQTACVQVMCPPGSGGNAATGVCAPCQPGTAGSGLDSLTPCPACLNGTVTNTTGAAACTACALDQISNANNTECSKPADPFTPGQPVCKNSTLTAASGTYTLSPTPYGFNENCLITLVAGASCAGRCNIIIQATGDTQPEDVLTFYTVPSGSAANAANNPANIVTSVSGVFDAAIPIMSTTTGQMAVRFTSDQLDVGAGWGFTWAVVPAPHVGPDTPAVCASRVINARQGSVSDGSGAAAYGDNEDCTITIDVGCAGCNVTYTATGALESFDSLTLTANGATAFSMTNAIAIGPTVVAPADGKLSLRFLSDVQVGDAGWVFNWAVL